MKIGEEVIVYLCRSMELVQDAQETLKEARYLRVLDTCQDDCAVVEFDRQLRELARLESEMKDRRHALENPVVKATTSYENLSPQGDWVKWKRFFKDE